MASLKKNGTEIGRLETLSSKVSYRSNGKVLINRGAGWKVRDSFKPAEIHKVFARERDDFNGRHLMLEVFEKAFRDTFSSTQEQYLAFGLFCSMSHDGDGLASLLQDAGIDVTHEDANNLVRKWRDYRVAVANAPHKVYYMVGRDTHILRICGTRKDAKIQGCWEQENLRSMGENHTVLIAPAKPSEMQLYGAAGNALCRS